MFIDLVRKFSLALLNDCSCASETKPIHSNVMYTEAAYVGGCSANSKTTSRNPI